MTDKRIADRGWQVIWSAPEQTGQDLATLAWDTFSISGDKASVARQSR